MLLCGHSLQSVEAPIKVAVMGCVVNGPGEARDADIGVACGKGSGAVFVRGEVVRKVSENDIVNALMEEIDKEYDNQSLSILLPLLLLCLYHPFF